MPACSVCSNERGAFLRFLLQWRQCACTLRYCRKCFRALPKPASGKWWDRFDKLCRGGGGTCSGLPTPQQATTRSVSGRIVPEDFCTSLR